MSRILLLTYSIKITDRSKNDLLIAQFNGSDDYFSILTKFLEGLLDNIIQGETNSSSYTTHLTLEGKPDIDAEKRIAYGFFSSGVSGEKYLIKNIESREKVADVSEKDAAFRNLFFYFALPKVGKNGALILQKHSKFSNKTAVKRALNQHLHELGYDNYRIEVNNIMSGNVYRRMLNEGRVKKVELVKKKIPRTLDEYYSNDSTPSETHGTVRTSFSSRTGLPDYYRKLVGKLFDQQNRDRIEIQDVSEDFDEVEFELELNGLKKKFFVQNKHRIQPTIDVTDDIAKHADGTPTKESLLIQCEFLVSEMIQLKPSAKKS